MMEIWLVFVWILAFLGLGVATLPFAAWLVPETEYVAFAIPIALAVLTVVGHLIGQVLFGWPALLAGLAVLVSLSGVGFKKGDFDLEPRVLGEYGVVFIAGFLLVVVIRGVDPAIAPIPVSAGEKFLDFGLLQTLDRSSSLPPESMWFAGESMQYYYGGQLLTVLLATMTGTEMAYAYNLALAGFFGTLLVSAYGLAASIARPYDVSRRHTGILGAFFVGVAGNLDTAIRLLAWVLPNGIAEPLVSSVGMSEDVTNWTPEQFYYWDASRVVPVEPGDPEVEFRAATEFPLFSWLNGDLHAHMMSQPFMLLAAAILLATWRAPVSHRRILLFLALPPVVGLIGFLNLWSLPTVLGLTTLGVALAPDHPATLVPQQPLPDGEILRVLGGLLVAVIVLAGGVIWTLPFWTTVIVDSPSQSVTYWEQWTPLGPLLVVFGAFIAAFAVYLSRAVWAATERVTPAIVFTIGGFVVTLSVLVGVPAVGLTLPLILLGWWLLRQTDARFELLLVVAGAGIVCIVEFVTIEGERFNVIFKPYAHVWLFWSIAIAVVLPRLAAGWPANETDQTAGGADNKTRRLRRTGSVLVVCLVLLTVPYAGLALPEHVETGTETTDELGTTLDGLSYLEVHYPSEAPAIRWLDTQTGQPTMLTAAPAGYTWDSEEGEGAAAPASLTGIPTVAGWTHEQQYRGREVYRERVQDVWKMYGGDPSTQRALLAEYDVQYIYVGPAEQNSRQEITVQQLDSVTIAKSWDSVTIYEVQQDQID